MHLGLAPVLTKTRTAHNALTQLKKSLKIDINELNMEAYEKVPKYWPNCLQ